MEVSSYSDISINDDDELSISTSEVLAVILEHKEEHNSIHIYTNFGHPSENTICIISTLKKKIVYQEVNYLHTRNQSCKENVKLLFGYIFEYCGLFPLHFLPVNESLILCKSFASLKVDHQA